MVTKERLQIPADTISGVCGFTRRVVVKETELYLQIRGVLLVMNLIRMVLLLSCTIQLYHPTSLCTLTKLQALIIHHWRSLSIFL